MASVFTRFATEDILGNQQETVTRGLFSGNAGSLLTFYTSSTQTTTQKRYFLSIYQSASTAVGSAPQVDIAYGHRLGSGSADSDGSTTLLDKPTQAIYSQYSQLLLSRNDFTFTIDGVDTDSIFVLNFHRARTREGLDPGNFQLGLAELSGSGIGTIPNNAFTGSNVELSGRDRYITLIDDSTAESATIGEYGRRYQMVSGTIDTGIYNATNPQVYGLMYPDLGIVVLDANRLNASASFNTVTGSGVDGFNTRQLLISMSGSAVLSTANGGIQARNMERVKSTYYFVRAKAAQFNFSNNPTFVTGSDGDIRQSTFIGDPKTYITTVGLYNDRQELLAVAKLSKPLLKSFVREALIKVKIDF